ncbi:MAG: membrane dipeptidase [Pseudomonadales bacterium]|nr:membrane dipeptidase [Pseudomonadales bacterium]
MKLRLTLMLMALLAGPAQAADMTAADSDLAARLQRIAAISPFADMHAHPSRFHRSELLHVEAEEIDRYLSNNVRLAVANISSDMPYTGRYTLRDGTVVPRGKYKPSPGTVFELTMDRMQRLQETFRLGLAEQGDTPLALTRTPTSLVFIPALEGGDALEGKIDNLVALHEAGLRLIQLVHFRANAIGHIQTHPYSPGGLTSFGEAVVSKSNELNIIIDLAHANDETMWDVLRLSKDPVIFSHGSVKAISDIDRAVSDDLIRAIAAGGGIIGIWPNGAVVEDIGLMVDMIEHVIKTAGIGHVGIGTDLRGVSRYATGFTPDDSFMAVARVMIERGYSDEDIARVLGGNFIRLWKTISEQTEPG